MDLKNYGWRDAGSNCSHRYLLPAVTRELRAFLGTSGRVLDLGCGNGFITAQLADQGFDVVGVEPSEDGINHARAAYPKLRFEAGSVYDDSLGPDLHDFDAVVSLEVLEHLYFPRKLFQQAFRVLRPGGRLILSTPYHGYWKNLALAVAGHWDKHANVDWDGGHIKFFSFRSATKMAEEVGFRGVRCFGVGRLPYLWMSMFLVADKPA
jgi:2-polyprenyl-6-hydroxyphenyl methylase/3-demethylubiquinone-9 3-methyltransferase